MNLLRKTIISLLFLPMIFGTIKSYAGNNRSKLYNTILSVSKRIKPLPLIYARKNDRRRDYDETTKILYSLMHKGDGLVIMAPDGDYTVFDYVDNKKIISQNIPYKQLGSIFKSLPSRYNRLWVVLVNYKEGWQAKPTKKYASALKSNYMKLPLPMPTYLTDKDVKAGTTNFWLHKSKLLEKIAEISPENRNPRLYLQLGQVYRKFGRLSDAVKAYRTGVKYFPNDPFLHRKLGECYYWDYSPPLLEESIKENRIANQCHINKFAKPKYDAMFNIAMAYKDLDELSKSQLQYNDILLSLNEFPDPYFESQTRRYLADIYVEMGRTNDAAMQYRLDIQLAAQPLSYSYKKLLNIYSVEKNNMYDTTVKDYFTICGENDAAAVISYIKYLDDKNDDVNVISSIKTVKSWMKSNTNLLDSIKIKPEWWNVWTNATISRGMSPVKH